MCEKTVLRNFGRMLCAVSLFAFVAEAAQITEDTTITVDADSEEDYDVAAGVTLTLSVASGSDYTLAGVVSGQGSLRKEGAGVLKLSNSQNSISGSIYNNAGSLFAVVSHAFGTSAITNYGSAMLVFDAQDGVFPNSIWAKDTISAQSNPDLCPIQFRKNTELQGDMTAIRSCIRLGNHRSSTSTDSAKGPSVSITGNVKTVWGSGYGFADCLYGTNTFHGAIDSSHGLMIDIGTAASANGILELESPENKIWGRIQIRNTGVSCLADNVISNAAIYWYYSSCGNTPNGPRGTLSLNGHSQRIKSLESDANTFSNFAGHDASAGAQIRSSTSATLTILGESSSRSACCRIQDDITVVLDAVEFPGFVQTLSNRTCTTTGGLMVSNGTFRITGSASFPNVPRIYVGEHGVLACTSSVNSVFASCANLVVDGKLALGGNVASAFPKAALALGASAELTMPAGQHVTVRSLSVDGEEKPDGTYGDGGDFVSQIKQGAVVVRRCDRYVDCVNGSDSNDGAYGRPYKTIRAATTNAISGDVIHVAPGTYGAAEGVQLTTATATAAFRVILPEGVTLESTGGATNTFIVGAPAEGANIDNATYGTGTNAVRCVYAKDGATLRGFTLTGGRGIGGSSGYNAGAAFYSMTALGATVEDCIISNNVAYRATIYQAVVRRCRVIGNTCTIANNTPSGAAGESCSWHNCIIAENLGNATVFDAVAFENCTLGAGNKFLDGSSSAQVLYWWQGDRAIKNCVVLDGRYYCQGRICLTNCLIATSVGSDIDVERSYNTIFTNSAAAQVDSEYRPVLGSFVGIDAGDAAYSTEALGDRDAYGTPRILNAALDMGAVEYDWRPMFAHEIGKRFKMTYASPSVTTNAAGGLLIGAGGGFDETVLPCIAGMVSAAGPYEFKFQLTSGRVEVYVDGVLVGSASGAGKHAIRFEVADTSAEVRFVCAPDGESSASAIITRLGSANGLIINFR